MNDTVAAGTVFARRYRLDERLRVHAGAETWRALDTVLGRVVAVYVLPVGDERSERIADAARSAATVHDPRFLRVLDAAVHGDCVYVVREWVRGRNLASVLADGPLSPTSAGVLAREVAEAVTAAHALGVCHLRLDPTTVIVADDGAVKITGLGTEAVVQGIECADDKVAAEDAAGIGRVLYAALTARWPGQGGDLPPAPTVDGRTARPRQVRAGVPRELDDVVERTLSRAPHHGAPLRTPREVAEALGAAVPVTGRGAAYLLDVGEDSGSTQPGTAAAPVSALDNGQSAAPPRPAARPVDRRPEPTRRRGRGVARGVGVVAGALLLIGAALIGWQLLTAAFPGLGARVEPDTSAAEGPSSASRTSAPPANARPVTIVAAHDFDPYGDPPEENSDRVARAVDGNPSTTWMTMTYFDPLELLKPGVGLYVDLGKPTDVRSVRLTLVGSPSDVQVRAAPADALEPPTALSGWAEVASRTGAGERATLTPGTAVRTRYVLVWFTKLPPVGGDYRVEVAEVEVRS